MGRPLHEIQIDVMLSIDEMESNMESMRNILARKYSAIVGLGGLEMDYDEVQADLKVLIRAAEYLGGLKEIKKIYLTEKSPTNGKEEKQEEQE